jgi:hypothetical protein
MVASVGRICCALFVALLAPVALSAIEASGLRAIQSSDVDKSGLDLAALKVRAELGDGESQFYLALRYSNGRVTIWDRPRLFSIVLTKMVDQ